MAADKAFRFKVVSFRERSQAGMVGTLRQAIIFGFWDLDRAFTVPGSVMTRFTTAVVLLITCVPALAADTGTMTHNIGIGAGFVTGYGISYRHWFPSDWGYQINFAPYYDKTEYSEERNLSLGITGLKVLHGAETVNLIGYAGASVLYDYDRYTYTYEFEEQETETTNTRYTFGGGPGFDVRFWHLTFSAMFGVRVSTESNDEVHMDITGETALFYSFD